MISQSNRGATAGFILAGIVALLSSCSGDTPIEVGDYTSRIARVLDENPGERVQDVMPRMPRRRALQAHFTEPSIDLLDFLDMGDCKLQALVAERNSSLGKVAEPSKQLVYEISFLQAGADCLPLLRTEEPELALRLDAVLTMKKAELPARIWQATLGGDEFRTFWSIDGDHRTPVPETVAAIRGLRVAVDGWLRGDYSVDATQLEEYLRLIAMGGGGAVLNAWWHLDHDITRATLVLESRRSRRSLCSKGMQNPDADIFRTVVTRFFMADVQREVASLNRVTFEVMAEVEALEQRLVDAEPAAYSGWRIKRSEIVAGGKRAMVDHVAAIEPLFRQCGFLPSTEGSDTIAAEKET